MRPEFGGIRKQLKLLEILINMRAHKSIQMLLKNRDIISRRAPKSKVMYRILSVILITQQWTNLGKTFRTIFFGEVKLSPADSQAIHKLFMRLLRRGKSGGSIHR